MSFVYTEYFSYNVLKKLLYETKHNDDQYRNQSLSSGMKNKNDFFLR